MSHSRSEENHPCSVVVEDAGLQAVLPAAAPALTPQQHCSKACPSQLCCSFSALLTQVAETRDALHMTVGKQRALK
jgi:hypothetical protein